MIDRRAEQSATLQSPRELSGQLLHAIDGGGLRHVFTKHFEILMKQGALICQCRLKHLATVNRVFDLSKDPRIRHCTAAYQNTVATRLAKTFERLLDGCYVAAT